MTAAIDLLAAAVDTFFVAAEVAGAWAVVITPLTPANAAEAEPATVAELAGAVCGRGLSPVDCEGIARFLVVAVAGAATVATEKTIRQI